MNSASALPAFATKIKQRPPMTLWSFISAIWFNLIFDLGMLSIHAVQVAALPLSIHPVTHTYFSVITEWSKGAYGQLLVFIAEIWAPTILRVTVDIDDQDVLDLSKIVRRDSRGIVNGLDLPERMVLIANHQIYCDWSYLWNLLYFAQLQSAIVIVLKASLKWVPVVGPAMQMFNFIFMHRNWEKDQRLLGKSLVKLADQASKSLEPFVLLIFPEGTVVSDQTRPRSKAYADKAGLVDYRNLLLPRSTGLLFCLRSLAPRIPALKLLDVTIGYPGIPAGGFGQEYYTLQSVFSTRVPPPIVHMHLRAYSVKHDVPIGKTSLENKSTPAAPAAAAGIAASTGEKKEFDDWLLARWQEKDEMLEHFAYTGRLTNSDYIDIPIQLRSATEMLRLCLCGIFGLWITKHLAILLWHLVLLFVTEKRQ